MFCSLDTVPSYLSNTTVLFIYILRAERLASRTNMYTDHSHFVNRLKAMTVLAFVRMRVIRNTIWKTILENYKITERRLEYNKKRPVHILGFPPFVTAA
jgi:hypothetical protein